MKRTKKVWARCIDDMFVLAQVVNTHPTSKLKLPIALRRNGPSSQQYHERLINQNLVGSSSVHLGGTVRPSRLGGSHPEALGHRCRARHPRGAISAARLLLGPTQGAWVQRADGERRSGVRDRQVQSRGGPFQFRSRRVRYVPNRECLVVESRHETGPASIYDLILYVICFDLMAGGSRFSTALQHCFVLHIATYVTRDKRIIFSLSWLLKPRCGEEPRFKSRARSLLPLLHIF